MTPFDICVIGGGAAGLTVAAGAAQLGARVALVERRSMGGECLNFGCVPSKALLRAAEIAHGAARAGTFGLDVAPGPVDLARVMAAVQDVVAQIAPHDSPERFRGLGVEVVEATARFVGPGAIEAGEARLTARRFVIATGTRPTVPAIPGIDQVPYLTNETVFGLRETVGHLLILGGGAVGLELVQAFARLGIPVTLIESAPRLLPSEEPEVGAALAALLAVDGVRCLAGHQVLAAQGGAGAVTLSARDAGGETHIIEGTHLLIATGRTPVLDLGLERAGVRTDAGRLVLDARLRTTQKHIYACGDVAGPPYFTHLAEHEAGVVLRNALFHLPARVEQRVVPRCLFTDPEFARVGLSESAARAQGIRHRVYRVPLGRADRAATDRVPADGATAGFATLIATPGGKLLGASLLAPHAGEMIHECALALRQGLKLGDLSALIHAYPTYSQLVRFAADERMKQAFTPGRRRWLRRLFGLHGRQTGV